MRRKGFLFPKFHESMGIMEQQQLNLLKDNNVNVGSLGEFSSPGVGIPEHRNPSMETVILYCDGSIKERRGTLPVFIRTTGKKHQNYCWTTVTVFCYYRARGLRSSQLETLYRPPNPLLSRATPLYAASRYISPREPARRRTSRTGIAPAEVQNRAVVRGSGGLQLLGRGRLMLPGARAEQSAGTRARSSRAARPGSPSGGRQGVLI